ncbi:uncharacterized protein LOC130137143 [Syzygium oleosum]|uniref:uncharacterized protein LOC130137143 n=1 Tax=Syzygium oleosum TaxID=219896 RepID=UPI0024B99069|nr:uncharacterized protein LOC130137143 [Syzygium oleosum]
MRGVDKLSPYAKVKVPETFKEPEFSMKYDGTGCLKTHLKYYLRKMARYSDNIPLLIQTFQDSLIGPALSWFIALDVETITAWEDLAEEFLQQYRFNSEIIPTREDLVRLEKRRNEPFKAFAQRWRTMASQVKPPLIEREMRQLFLKTLPPEYFHGMLTFGCQTFSQLVEVGEGVEWAIVDGRIPAGNSKGFPIKKNKETAVEVAFVQEPSKSFSAPPQKPSIVQGHAPQGHDRNKRFPHREFSPLPKSLSKLLPMFIERRMVAKEVPRDNPPRFPGFDMTKTCEYHRGERGHDTDNCFALKIKIQNLLDKGILSFERARPNVKQNPLPDHAEGVNVVFKKANVSKQTFMVNIPRLYEILQLAGHHEGGEDVTMEEKLDYVRRMMSMGVIGSADMGQGLVAMTTPVVIYFSDEDYASDQEVEDVEPMIIDLATEEFSAIQVGREDMTRVVIELPPLEEEGVIILEAPPDFNTKTVPWDYETDEVDAITRSGRCYAPAGGIEKKAVTEEDAKQFLAVIKTSEFNVVNQLRKMPAQISLLDLFKSSEKHKDALLKVLNEVHVPKTIDEAQLEEFVGTILLKDQISFADEDFPVEGRNHNKALYISIKHHDMMVARTLIDNGFALNLCPLATLRLLKVDLGKMRTAKNPVRAFDGTRREVIGEIELELLVGPVTFLVPFQVLDIPSAFNFLLGRPWIHTAGAVPSGLHQKVRFVVDGKLVTVHGETDFKVYHEIAIPYVEPECKEESSFQTLELVSMVHVPVGSLMGTPELSKPTLAAGKIMLANGYNHGEGLGLHGQGIRKPIEVEKGAKREGLGYQRSQDNGDRGNRESRDNGGRGNDGGRGNRGGRGGSRGRGNNGGRSGCGGRGSDGGRGNQGGRGAGKGDHGGHIGVEKGCRGLLLPLLKEMFPGPPKMLHEEEAAIDSIAKLFEENVICTILTCEEAESSGSVADPAE